MTVLGFLTAFVATLGILAGGVPIAGGFRLSYDIGARELFVMPIIVLHFAGNPNANENPAVATATALGGTILTDSNHSRIILYELGHVSGWMHFGLQYPLYALSDACAYDPSAFWAAGCGVKFIRTVNPATLEPRHYAFSIRF